MAINPELNIHITADDNTAAGFQAIERRIERLQRDLRKLNAEARRVAQISNQSSSSEVERIRQATNLRSDGIRRQTAEVSALTRYREAQDRAQLERIRSEGRLQLQTLRNTRSEEQDLRRIRATNAQESQDFRTREFTDYQNLGSLRRSNAREQQRLAERYQSDARGYRRQEIAHQTSLRRAIQRTAQVRANALGTVIGILSGEMVFALEQVARRTLEVTKNFEQIRLGFGTFEGSQRIADIQIARIRELARLPSVSFEGGIRSVLQLRSAGFNFETSERLLTEISNQVALSGKSTDDLNRALYQLIQTGGLQQFRTEELRQLFEIVPQLRQVFQDLFGTATGEGIQDAMKALDITFDEAMDRLLTRLEETPRAPTDTLTNKLENLADTWDDLLRRIGTLLLPVIKLVVDALSELIKSFQDTLDFSIAQFFEAPFIWTETFWAGLTNAPQGEVDAKFREMIKTARTIVRTTTREHTPEEKYDLIPGIGPKIEVGMLNKWLTSRLESPLVASLDRRDLIQKDLDLLKPSFLSALDTIRTWRQEVDDFNKTGKIATETIDALTKGSDDLLKPIRALLTQNEKRLDDLRKTYILSRQDQNISRKEREERYQLYKREVDLIENSNEKLREFIKAREQELNVAREAFKESARERLKNRKPPDLTVSPDQALPGTRIRPGQKFYNQDLRQTQVELNQGRPIPTERPLITRRPESVPTIESPLIPQFNPYFQNILPPNIGQITEDMMDRIYSGLLGRQVPVPPRVFPIQEPVGDLTIPELPDRELLDPRRLKVITQEVNNLLTEWVDVRQETQRFVNTFNAIDGSIEIDLFNEQNLRLAKNTTRELEEMRSTLLRFAVELEGLDDVPERLLQNIADGARQLGVEIDRLFKIIDYGHALAADLRGQEIDRRVELTNQEYNQLAFGQPELPSYEQAYQAYQRALEPQRRALRDAAREREQAFASYFSDSAESLYDQFVAPSLLDIIGFGSGRSAAKDRAIDDLRRSVEEAQRAVREDAILGANQRHEELLEITREFEREKREIERQYEQERSDAWKDWVRQQLTDFPKLIFQQLNLQLATRATNKILQSLNLGGNIPITQGGLGNLIGTASTVGSTQYTAPIGPGLAGAQLAGGGAALGTAGSAAVGVAAAATAINGLIDPVKDLSNSLSFNKIDNPFGSIDINLGDIGKLSSVLSATSSIPLALAAAVDPITELVGSFGFHNAANDQYAMREAAKAGKKITGSQTPSQYGRKSAKDLVDNIVGGLQEGMQSGGNMESSSGGNVTQILIPNYITTKIGNREIQEVNEVSVLLDETNRLVSPGNSRVQKDLADARVTAAINSAIDSKIRALERSVTAAQTAANNAEESTRRLRQDVEGKINLGDIL